MKPNFDKIFCDDLNTVHKNGLVDLERLYNLLSVMNEQQKRLDSASEKLESHGVERQYKLNKKCIEYLQNFIIDLNAVYKSKQFKWEE